MKSPRLQPWGFTLLELMVVVAIIGILATLAVGSIGNVQRVQQAKDVSRAVMQTLALGRAEAVRRGSGVTVNVDSTRFIAFIDANANLNYDTGETSIARYPLSGSLYTGVVIASPDLASKNAAQLASVVFDYQGYAQDSSKRPLSATICINDASQNFVRAVQLTVAGATRLLADAPAAALCP